MKKPTENAGKTQEKRDSKGRFKKGAQNGTPFEKGNNANPRGRANSISDAIRRKDSEINGSAQLAEIAWEKAIEGDKGWAEFVAGYAQGKPQQSIEVIERDPDDVIEIG